MAVNEVSFDVEERDHRRAHRPERGGQDDRIQPHHRQSPLRQGSCPLRGQRHHELAHPPHRQARHRPDLPDDPPLPESLRARKRAGRLPLPDELGLRHGHAPHAGRAQGREGGPRQGPRRACLRGPAGPGDAAGKKSLLRQPAAPRDRPGPGIGAPARHPRRTRRRDERAGDGGTDWHDSQDPATGGSRPCSSSTTCRSS